MASSFPTSLDALTNPTSTDNLDSTTVPHATQHANANDAIEALQAKVGINSSAVTTSHDYKITQLELHLADTSDAHDASAISILDTANDFTATDVEGALAELQADNEAHLADTSGAHAASAISFSPTGSVAATDVQAAIAEVASEAGQTGDLIDWQLARKTADESVTSSTTLQNDDHLSFAIAASEVWVFQAVLYLSASNATGDIATAFTVPAGATVNYGAVGPAEAITSAVGDATFRRVTASAAEVHFGLFNGDSTATLFGIVVNGATPGTVQLQWAQETSDASAVTLRSGSHLIARRGA